jgi:predicted lipid-binding transport protein (Tim44 family)
VNVEIVLLAMVALFVGLRLYTVLGRRSGHEQQPVTRPDAVPGTEPAAPVAEVTADRSEGGGLVYEDGAAAGVRAIVTADNNFDVARFLEGAQAAYRMVLEAFWRGDKQELAQLSGGEVRHRFENRLVAIERAVIEDAKLDGRTASITVRFDADIAAVTRDADGNVIGGSLEDAVPAHDIWTFQRDLSSADPNWLLVDTDDA